MKKVFVIAEAGVNHNGNLGLALKLVDQAVLAGADAVKFQAAIPEMVATGAAQKAGYQQKTTGSEECQLDMIRRLLLPMEAFLDIATYCRKKGIIFFSTAFDLVSLNYLEHLGQPYHKIPSGEITNLPYLRQIGSYCKPLILSTGMAKLGEIEAAIEVLEVAGTPRSRITVLHCNTEYPTPLSDVNLRAMQTIKEAFGVEIGYSDHTHGFEIAIAAVALGARMIEKHMTLDRSLPGPDHMASLEPEDFKAMVLAIRNVEQALGTAVKSPSNSEIKNRSIVRRSLVALRNIKSGEIFSAENITAKRSGAGISPMQWDEVIGRLAPSDFDKDELIEL
jgi:N,N'-diacetyllegionaminate synthase